MLRDEIWGNGAEPHPSLRIRTPKTAEYCTSRLPRTLFPGAAKGNTIPKHRTGVLCRRRAARRMRRRLFVAFLPSPPPSALPPVTAMALAQAGGPVLGCSGPLPLNMVHGQGGFEQTCVGGGHRRGFVKIRGCCSGGRAGGLVPFHQGLCAAGGMREGAAMRVCLRAPLEKAGRGRRGRWRRGGQKAHLVSAAFMCKAATQGSALAPSWNRSRGRSQTFQGCCTLEGWLLVPNAAGASALN